MDNLLGYDGIIHGHSAWDKAALVQPNYVTKEGSQSVNKNF